MYRCLSLLLVLSGMTALATDVQKPNPLTPQEIADGWIMLFDGESTFGWLIHGPATAHDGVLVLGGDEQTTAVTTTAFGPSDYVLEHSYDGKAGEQYAWVAFGTSQHWLSGTSSGKETMKHNGPVSAGPVTPFRIVVPAGTKLEVRQLKIRPYGLESIFNGKDLSGWKVFPVDRYRSKFTVTPEGWLNVQDGPGDLQTEKQWADFIFQGECISHGQHLNSGIFFRCLPNQYQNGYEVQIRNQWQGDDRTKPVDFGTGAIYRRQPARKVVSTDGEWFAMTLVAHGNHFATWINGYPVVDWTDTRPANPNPRNGSRLDTGHISIQGHDPTTNLSFRNLRIAELTKKND